MRAFLAGLGLLTALGAAASAAGPREVSLDVAPVLTSQGAPSLSALPQLPALAPSAASALPAIPALPSAAVGAAPAAIPAAGPAAVAAAPASAAAASPASSEPAEEPTAEDVQAAQTARILRNPTVPPRVARLIERELGLAFDHSFFENISVRGSQPRNSHTNEPLGEAHRPVNPKHTILGLFQLRQDHRAYYDSLKNAKTGVVATGMRGGVDTMVEDLLDKGYIQPRSAGRNHRFLNGVYMDLPDYIHEARKYAAVDPYRTEGKDRYPMYVAFRAGNVHNPGADYQGRIVGDGGTLGHVALDHVTPADVVSIYVERSRIAQTKKRIEGTPLEHAQVLPIDVLPKH